MSNSSAERESCESSPPITGKGRYSAILSLVSGCLACGLILIIIVPVSFVSPHPHNALVRQVLFYIVISVPTMSIIAVVSGITTYVRTRKDSQAGNQRKKAKVGICLGATLTFLIVILSLPVIVPRFPYDRRHSSCQNNLKVNGSILDNFRDVSEGGLYPAIPTELGALSLANKGDHYPSPLYPRFFSDFKTLNWTLVTEAAPWGKEIVMVHLSSTIKCG